MNDLQTELILKIHRVLDKNNNEWMPAIEDVASHDIDPMWVAGVAYLIIDRYVSSISESNQNQFYKDVMVWFNKMAKNEDTTEYIEKIDFKNPDN
jgi:hypothetical protein